MHIETDIDLVRLLAEEKEDENWRFRAYLKASHLSTAEIDRAVWQHLEIVTPRIDCTACANCCKVMSPQLKTRDVRRLADHLHAPEEQLINDYLQPSEEKGRYTFRAIPCSFLQEGCCTVYEARPDDCRSFPHLHKREFRTRLMG